MLKAAAVLALVFLAPATAMAQSYASLRSGDVNMRTGPGARYPTSWVWQKAGEPFEVLANYENWVKVRASDGTTGWFLRTTLSRRRTFKVITPHILRRGPDDKTVAVARVEKGVIGAIRSCAAGSAWCRVQYSEGVSGFVKRSDIWGVNPDEAIKE
ncbi:MAG: SH3 domain-containing protein [Alphaproteobacteria bacterium]|nr:SH3 domain-containing protein [Alphaproteobacteria bacterium]